LQEQSALFVRAAVSSASELDREQIPLCLSGTESADTPSMIKARSQQSARLRSLFLKKGVVV
jgi:hypothetical protein